MKKVVIGLLALSSVTAFASDCSIYLKDSSYAGMPQEHRSKAVNIALSTGYKITDSQKDADFVLVFDADGSWNKTVTYAGLFDLKVSKSTPILLEKASASGLNPERPSLKKMIEISDNIRDRSYRKLLNKLEKKMPRCI